MRDLLAPFLRDTAFSPNTASPWTDDGQATPRNDRLRILYPVRPDPDRGLTMGLYRRGTHEPIELRSCEIQDPVLTEVGNRALAVFRDRGLSPYDETRHEGLLRGFSARLAPSTGELLLGVVTTTADLPDAAGLASDLAGQTDDLPVSTVGVVHNVHPQPGNTLVGPEWYTLAGRDHLWDAVDGLRLRIGFGSFYQLHRASDALLYQPALKLCGDVSGAEIVDGYAGVGTFALRLARRGAARVLGVEANPAACADFAANAEANDAPTVRVLESPFEAAEGLPEADLLVVDPSRKGLLAKGCAQVRRLAAPRVLYVACDVSALARDLAVLPEYRLIAVRLADLFPHTEHVEVLALLVHRGCE